MEEENCGMNVVEEMRERKGKEKGICASTYDSQSGC